MRVEVRERIMTRKVEFASARKLFLVLGVISTATAWSAPWAVQYHTVPCVARAATTRVYMGASKGTEQAVGSRDLTRNTTFAIEDETNKNISLVLLEGEEEDTLRHLKKERGCRGSQRSWVRALCNGKNAVLTRVLSIPVKLSISE